MSVKPHDSNKPSWTSKYKRWRAKAEQSEQWLLERWDNGDEEDRVLVERVLNDLYRPKLVRHIRTSMACSVELAEDITQQVLFELHKVLKVHGSSTSVAPFLFGRAHHRIMDQYRGSRALEISMEKNLPLVENRLARSSDVDESPEEILAQREAIESEREFFRRFVEPQFSDCQRMVWTMRARLQLDRPMTARLLGKDAQTISSTYTSTKERLKKYRNSKAYELDRAYWEVEEAATASPASVRSLLVERSLDPMVPNFTLDELRPLGLTSEDLKKGYVCSWILPAMGTCEEQANQRLLLLIAKRHHWDLMQDYLRFQFRGRGDDAWSQLDPELWAKEREMMEALAEHGTWIDHEYYAVPEEYLVGVTVSKGDVHLKPIGPMMMRFMHESVLAYWQLNTPRSWMSFHSSGHASRITQPVPEIYTGHWSYDDPESLQGYLSKYDVDRQTLLEEWLKPYHPRGESALLTKSDQRLDTLRIGPHLPVIITD